MTTIRAAGEPRTPGRSHWLAHSLRASGPFLLAAPWLACARDEPGLVDPPSLSQEAAHTVSGRLLGPDGRNICRTIEEGTMLVRLLNPDFDGTNDFFLGEQDITCPDNAYSLPVDADIAHLRVELPISPTLGRLPFRNLDQVPVPASGVNHNVNLDEGTALGGRARLDGHPFEGVILDLRYDFKCKFRRLLCLERPRRSLDGVLRPLAHDPAERQALLRLLDL